MRQSALLSRRWVGRALRNCTTHMSAPRSSVNLLHSSSNGMSPWAWRFSHPSPDLSLACARSGPGPFEWSGEILENDEQSATWEACSPITAVKRGLHSGGNRFRQGSFREPTSRPLAESRRYYGRDAFVEGRDSRIAGVSGFGSDRPGNRATPGHLHP